MIFIISLQRNGSCVPFLLFFFKNVRKKFFKLNVNEICLTKTWITQALFIQLRSDLEYFIFLISFTIYVKMFVNISSITISYLIISMEIWYIECAYYTDQLFVHYITFRQVIQVVILITVVFLEGFLWWGNYFYWFHVWFHQP